MRKCTPLFLEIPRDSTSIRCKTRGLWKRRLAKGHVSIDAVMLSLEIDIYELAWLNIAD